MSGIGSHQSSRMKNDEWLTPPEIITSLGNFDIDPCSPELSARPWDTAKNHFSKSDDGLNQEWQGRVWLNPPYGREAAVWLQKLAEHGDGIALIFARTETDMFFRYVWGKANSILFIRGRLHFHYVDGTRAKANAGAPSCLIAYGKSNTKALLDCGIDGRLVLLKE